MVDILRDDAGLPAGSGATPIFIPLPNYPGGGVEGKVVGSVGDKTIVSANVDGPSTGRWGNGISGSYVMLPTGLTPIVVSGIVYLVPDSFQLVDALGETFRAGDRPMSVVPETRNPGVVRNGQRAPQNVQANLTIPGESFTPQAAQGAPLGQTTPGGIPAGQDASGPSSSGSSGTATSGPTTSATSTAPGHSPGDGHVHADETSGVTGNVDDSGIGADSTDAEIEAYIREELGFLAWAIDIPELKALVFKSLRDNSTEEQIIARLQNTDWWRATEPQAREWTKLQSEDPAFAARLVKDVALNIRLEALRLGIDIDPDRLEAIAGEAITFGWVDLNGGARGNLLTQAIFNEALFQPEDLAAGALAISIDELRQTADDYMVTISEDTAAVWAERIELGEATAEAFQKYIADLSASRFPHLKGIIEQGISPRSHFEPYRQQAAALLETSADQIDLFNDPRFSEIVEVQTDGGVRSMTLAEAQKHIRKMPEWQSTTNGMVTAARTANAVLEAFGETA